MEIKDRGTATDNGYICQHCGTKVGFLESHNCYLSQIHAQLDTKKKRKKNKIGR